MLRAAHLVLVALDQPHPGPLNRLSVRRMPTCPGACRRRGFTMPLRLGGRFLGGDNNNLLMAVNPPFVPCVLRHYRSTGARSGGGDGEQRSLALPEGQTTVAGGAPRMSAPGRGRPGRVASLSAGGQLRRWNRSPKRPQGHAREKPAIPREHRVARARRVARNLSPARALLRGRRAGSSQRGRRAVAPKAVTPSW